MRDTRPQMTFSALALTGCLAVGLGSANVWAEPARYEIDPADQTDEIGETEWFCDSCGGLVASEEIDEHGRCPRCEHVIVLQGAGKGFCGGYDLQEYAETPGEMHGNQDMPWDPMLDFRMMYANTQDFMALWRSYKPTIA